MQAGDQNPGGKRVIPDRWQDRIQDQIEDVVDRAEEELRTLITYINDEVVPDVRRSSSEALRTAAAELGRLAEKMDSHRAGRRTGTNPKP